jgi:drug/metabolite transporter (DMT)-like permease
MSDPARAADAPDTVKRRRHAYFLLAAIVVFWGVNWPVMKVGLADIPPFWFAGFRLALGAASLFLLLAVTGRLALPRRADLPVIASVGLVQMGFCLATINFGLLYVPAGRSAVLAYTTPLWVAPAAALVLGERLTWRRLAGVGLGIGGLMLLFEPASFDWSSRTALFGNGLLLASAAGWALAIIHVRAHRWHGTPLALVPWQLLAGAIPLLAIAWFYHGWASIHWNARTAIILAYNGPVTSGFCYWAVVEVTRRLPALSASLAFLAVPCVGLASASLALDETIHPMLLAGFALILGGLVLVETGRTRRAA